MIDEFVLKDGRKATVEVWNFETLERLTSLESPEHMDFETLEGFKFLTPLFALLMRRSAEFAREKYSEARHLSPLEIQADRSLSNEQYHRVLAALHDRELCGILICEWVREMSPFWVYKVKLVDVRERDRNLGVATNLVSALDQADFVKSRIVQAGTYSEDGERYLRKVFDTELRAERYALIPSDYCPLCPPTEPGVYSRVGELLQPSYSDSYEDNKQTLALPPALISR